MSAEKPGPGSGTYPNLGPGPTRAHSSASSSTRSLSSSRYRRKPTPLRHPTPSDLNGVYTRSILNLEKSAEEMSAGGSDIGEEIRKMNELSRQNSIQSSHHGDISVVRPSVMERMGSARSERSSSYGAGARGRSLREGNEQARWGGYSPGGYVTSPVGSVSGSWSHPSLSRVASGSGSKASPLAQVSEPVQEGRPLDSPLRPSFSVHESERGMEEEVDAEERSREVSESSFAKRYDEIAGQIEDSLEHVPPSPPKHDVPLHDLGQSDHLTVDGMEVPDRPRSTDTYREAQTAFQDFDGVHFNPDTDEFVEVDQEGNEVRRVSARNSSGGLSLDAVSILRAPRGQPIAQPAPPPEDGMVYYPAPVPKTLNLPKRLSLLPAASVQAKKRSQMLSGLPPEAVAGAPWISQDKMHHYADGTTGSIHHNRGSGSTATLSKPFLNERMSENTSYLAPQLRANMFFEHSSVPHDIEVKSESAVATLDSILAASATAPVHAFTDHPFAGDVRKSVYSHEAAARKSTSTLPTDSPEQKKTKKRRSSSIGALLKRTISSDEVTNKLNKKSSRGSLMTDLDGNEGPKKLQKRRSQMSLGSKSQLSLGDDLDRTTEPIHTPGRETPEPGFQSGLIASAQNATPLLDDEYHISRSGTAMSARPLDDGDQINEDFNEAEKEENADEDAEPLFVQPSTLLAELQVRKAQQKSRNKTAATHFPQGMHSTLLQMDAVEEISKRKRQNQRINLAWEDPHQRALQVDADADDEDVPLGVLFPSKEGKAARKVGDGRDWERPLGLMERREMEDSEPLSSRRFRLRGIDPAKVKAMEKEWLASTSQVNLPQEEAGAGAEEEGYEGETLGERMKRMKTKDALDGALADVAPREGVDRPVSGFVDDVMSQFGGLEVEDKDKDDTQQDTAATAPAPPVAEEDETLGQRRARLQREREASGEQQRNVSDGSLPATRPGLLRSSTSLANLLATNPIGQRRTSKNYTPTAGTLLHANAKIEARQRSQLLNTNTRANSYYLDKPLVDGRVGGGGGGGAERGLLGMEDTGWQKKGGFGGGMWNNGMGGVQLGLQHSNTMPAMPTGNMMNPYFPSPTTGQGYGAYGYGYGNQMMHPGFGHPGMAMNAGGFMGNGNMGNGFMGGTYAAYAQNPGMAMGMGAAPGMPGFGMGMEELDSRQRDLIEQWRTGVSWQ